MMAIDTLIIDDEFLARQRIKQRLDKDLNFKLLGECSNGEEAIEKINTLRPNLVFLDIKLKDMTGFQVLNNISYDLNVVFVSAFDSYAINAFEKEAIDFILKPFENDRFEDSLKRIINYFDEKSSVSKISGTASIFRTNAFNKLSYSVGNKIKFLNYKDIKYVLASGSYCELFTIEDKKIVLRNSLNNIIGYLDPLKFIRVHRSTIINIEYLEEIINSSYLETDVKMTDGKTFRVSKSKRKEMMNFLRVS